VASFFGLPCTVVNINKCSRPVAFIFPFSILSKLIILSS